MGLAKSEVFALSWSPLQGNRSKLGSFPFDRQLDEMVCWLRARTEALTEMKITL